MDIEKNVAQYREPGDDAETPDAGAVRSPLDRWAPIDSRLGWAGRTLKRALRRLYKGAFSTQAEHYDRLIARLGTIDERMDVSEAQMLSRVESIERTILEQLEPGLHRIEERARVTDKDWRESVDGIDERVESELIRIEAIERHQMAFQEDVSQDFRRIRVTAATQGRQIDDVAGQLVTFVQSVPELEARIRTVLDALPDPRAVLQPDLDALHAGQSELRDAQQRTLQAIDAERQTLEAALDRVREEAHSAIETLRHESREATSALSDAQSDLTAAQVALRGDVERARTSGSAMTDAHAALADQIETITAQQMAGAEQIETIAAQQVAGAERMESITALQAAGAEQIETITAHQVARSEQIETLAAQQHASAEQREALSERLASVSSEARRSVAERDERLERLERRTLPPRDLDHYDFNESFRGSREDIRARLETYVQHFEGLSQVLDLGCGRGEFLELCCTNGIGAIGLDADPDMVGHARLNGLEIVEADLFDYLQELPDRDLDGIFSAQLIEHLSARELTELLDLASRKLRRGAPIVLETINPTTWSAMRWFHLDPTHVTPVPPAMLSYLLDQAGFEVVETVYGPVPPEEERLALPDPELKGRSKSDQEIRALLHRNWSRVNEALFGAQDYAIVAKR